MGRTVLVTGISRYLGARLVHLLQDEPDVDRIIGVDVLPPAYDLGRAEFVRADIRNPIIAKVIASAEVDTVAHLNVISAPHGAGGRPSMKEINVIGTMQLLAACQKAPSVRKLVVKSTTSVYGCSPRDPAMFTEEMEPKELPRSGWAKDACEVEGYVRGFGRRRPDVAVTVLRFAHFLGPGIDTPLTRYFSLPVIPKVLGFDARLQFIHEDDALEALRRTTVEDHPGTYNIAGDGVVLLSQAARRLGRPMLPVPTPATSAMGLLLRRLGLVDFTSEQLRYLTYGSAVDTTRMREELKFEPRYSTLEAFDDFVRARGLRRVIPVEPLERLEARLAASAGEKVTDA